MNGQTPETRRMSAELKAHRMKWNQRIGIGADLAADPDTILPAIMDSELDQIQDHADTLYLIGMEDAYMADQRIFLLAELIRTEVREMRRLQGVMAARITEIKTQGGIH